MPALRTAYPLALGRFRNPQGSSATGTTKLEGHEVITLKNGALLILASEPDTVHKNMRKMLGEHLDHLPTPVRGLLMVAGAMKTGQPVHEQSLTFAELLTASRVELLVREGQWSLAIALDPS